MIPRVPTALLSVVAVAVLASCTKAVRISPVDYASALSDTTRTFQIRTHDGHEFVSEKAVIEQDSVLVVSRGYEVQVDARRQKASAPFEIPLNDIESASQVELSQDRSLVLALAILAVVVAGAAVLAMAGVNGGGS